MEEPNATGCLSAYDYGLKSPAPSTCTPRSKVSPCQYSDRLIPSRAATDLGTGLSLLEADENSFRGLNSSTATRGTPDDENKAVYDRLLRSELLGLTPQPMNDTGGDMDEPAILGTPERRSLFRYRSSPNSPLDDLAGQQPSQSASPLPLPLPLPLPFLSGGLMDSPAPPRPTTRKIPQEPCRILSAPRLEDDFYLNALDCSGSDVLAVGLRSCVDTFCMRTGQAARLCDLGSCGNTVTSVTWAKAGNGTHLAVGTLMGEVQIYDVVTGRKLRSMGGHQRRVAALAWHGPFLATGSRDADISFRDVRLPDCHATCLRGHSQEVCGLKWSPDGQHLASGGNEGTILIWVPGSDVPVQRLAEHEAAVKALAWSPHRRGLLASGGGTADKHLRVWNALNGTCISSVNTCSQVCDLLWSQSTDEIVTAQGYSGNEVHIWRSQGLSKVATLSSHMARVLHLAASTDGQTIITGAGDETIRFWSAFPPCTRPRAATAATPPSHAIAGVGSSLGRLTIR